MVFIFWSWSLKTYRVALGLLRGVTVNSRVYQRSLVLTAATLLKGSQHRVDLCVMIKTSVCPFKKKFKYKAYLQ